MLRKRKVIAAEITRGAHRHNITSNKGALDNRIMNGYGKVVLTLTEEEFWKFCDAIGEEFADTDADSIEVKISVPR